MTEAARIREIDREVEELTKKGKHLAAVAADARYSADASRRAYAPGREQAMSEARMREREALLAVDANTAAGIAMRRERFQLEGEIDRRNRGWTLPLPKPLPEMPDARLRPEERAEQLDLLVARLSRRLQRVGEHLHAAEARVSRANVGPFDGARRAQYDDATADRAALRAEQIACERLRQQVRAEVRQLETVTV